MKGKNPAAVELGSRTSKKKAAAARKNGKKGGRPRLRAEEFIFTEDPTAPKKSKAELLAEIRAHDAKYNTNHD